MATRKHQVNPNYDPDDWDAWDDPTIDPIYDNVQNTMDQNMDLLVASGVILGVASVIGLDNASLPSAVSSDTVEKILNLSIITDTDFFQDETGGIFSQSQISSLQDLQSDLKSNYIASDPQTVENLSINNAKNITDMVGGYGAQESWKAGFINTADNISQVNGEDLLIDWMCDAGACPICQGYHAAGPFTASTFPCSPHYKCVCWPNIADGQGADN